MKKKAILPVILIILALTGCSTANSTDSESSSAGIITADVVETSTSASEMFTDRDMEIGYNEETSVHITLSGDSASSDSSAVQISGSTVTITEEGTFILSGTLNNGMIVVNVDDTQKVQLVLDNANISNSTSAAIYILEADKVFITTSSGSDNVLANGGEYIAIDENNIDGVIFSKSDLTLNGAGTLTISANAGHGIVSKDDLVLTSGTYIITAANQGLSGKDSIRIANGTYTIVSGKDGVHAENADDTSLGFLYVAGGTFTITADGDGMSAGSYLQIENGTFNINTGEGSASVTMTSDTMNIGQRNSSPNQNTSSAEEDSVSQKGIKADDNITIADGEFTLDTTDDSIHAGGEISIANGEFNLKSGDDAIHSDSSIKIQGGSFIIDYCYEGIEGASITIDGGNFDITSQDDGLNAASGADSSGFGGGMSQQDQFTSNSDNFIIINDGTFTIVSNGDCIDSNGDLTINGGTLNLTCNGNGNTALDTNGTYTNNGGNVSTNDGSENNLGQMGGGMGNPSGNRPGRGGK